MSIEEIRNKIELAKEAVQAQEEPYKTEAFKIILSSLIGETFQVSGTIKKNSSKSNRKAKSTKRKSVKPQQVEFNQKNELEELAKKCGITAEALSEVITIKDNTIHIVKRPKIKETEKHVLFSTCILASYRVLYEIEWLSTNLLKRCLDESAVGDLGHYSEGLMGVSHILPRGDRRGKEYKITGKGLDIAFEIIKKLSNDESIVENSKK